MNSKRINVLAKKIIKKYGPVIDLRQNPEVLVDIMRELTYLDTPGTPCGGVPSPPPAPGPSGVASFVSNEDVLRAVLKLARDVSVIRTSLKSGSTKARSTSRK